MDEFQMSIDEMISALDTACGMLIVPMMKNPVVKEAHELIQKVSLSLGEASAILYSDCIDAKVYEEYA